MQEDRERTQKVGFVQFIGVGEQVHRQLARQRTERRLHRLILRKDLAPDRLKFLRRATKAGQRHALPYKLRIVDVTHFIGTFDVIEQRQHRLRRMIAILRQPPGGDAEVEVDEYFADVGKESWLGHGPPMHAGLARAR